MAIGRPKAGEADALYGGIPVTQVAELFRSDVKTVRRKIIEGNVAPCGKRSGVDVYHVRDVAPWLVKPAYDIETYIRRMNHTDLPPLLSKEFWNGLRARQRYELDAGNLWPTDQVLSVFAEVAKDLRMNLLLISDAIERETALTDRQREIVKSRIDEALEKIRADLVSKYAAEAERQAARLAEPGSGDRPEEDEDDDAFWHVPAEVLEQPDSGDGAAGSGRRSVDSLGDDEEL